MDNRESRIIDWVKAGYPLDEGVRLFLSGDGPVWMKTYLKRPGMEQGKMELLKKQLGAELEKLQNISGRPANDRPRVETTSDQLHRIRSIPKDKKAVVSLFQRTIPIESLPENLRVLRTRMMEWYFEALTLHAQAWNKRDIRTRRTMALKILDLWDLIDSGWKEIDYWVLHGRLIQKPAEDNGPNFDAMSVAELKNIKRNYDSYLCRHYKELKDFEHRAVEAQKRANRKETAKALSALGRKRACACPLINFQDCPPSRADL